MADQENEGAALTVIEVGISDVAAKNDDSAETDDSTKNGDSGRTDRVDPSSLFKLFDIYRDYIKHEDGLIHNRLSWNLSIQGFLFAAFALSIQKVVEFAKTDPAKNLDGIVGFHTFSWLVRWAIPSVGFLIGILSLAGVMAARIAIHRLEDEWIEGVLELDKNNRKSIDDHYNNSRRTPMIPRLIGGGSRRANLLGSWSPVVTPLVFIVIWGISFVLMRWML